MFVFDGDKSFLAPMCYHPTTVLAVDDEVQFLKALRSSLSKSVPLKTFDKPEDALNFVNSSREIQLPFAARIHFTGKNDTDICGFAKMSETSLQDIIHPFPKDIDMSFVKPKEESNPSPESAQKPHETLAEFSSSQYILTEKSFYYYNKMSGDCEWITSDAHMLKALNDQFQQEVAELLREHLDRIINITGHHRPNKLGFSINEIRNEPCNRNRFKEIILVITDFDMPGKNGMEFIEAVSFPGITLDHVVIILTGKISDEFKEKIKTLPLPTEYLGKSDPDCTHKLLALITQKTSLIFQDSSRKAISILAQDTKEDAYFAFDKGFGDIFTKYLKDNNICELYLFDRQGSYMFLDDSANLSWLIVRSEKGMENSVEKAIEYEAPESVIDALRQRKSVLSLYEESDFARLKEKSIRAQMALIKDKKKKEGDEAEVEPEIKAQIDWDSYLHPATVFESKSGLNEPSKSIGESSSGDEPCKHYYAFIKNFPDNGIDKTRILSYRDFLNQAN